jgi:hypothetical protein
MLSTFRIALAVTVAFVLAPVAAGAQSLGDRDAKEITDYVLTDAALAKYTKAVHKLQPLKRELQQDCDREDAPKSLNAMAARMDGLPGVKAALKSAGMTSREYMVFSLSVFQTGMVAWALEQPGGKLPPDANMANVNFYRAHEAELNKLGEINQQASCDNR